MSLFGKNTELDKIIDVVNSMSHKLDILITEQAELKNSIVTFKSEISEIKQSQERELNIMTEHDQEIHEKIDGNHNRYKDIFDKILRYLENINKNSQEIQTEVPSRTEINLPQVDELISRLENTIQEQSNNSKTFDQDLYHKILSPLLMELISIADRLDELQQNSDESTADSIRREKEAVIGVLHNFKVNYFVSEQGSAFNPDIQEAVGTATTDDPSSNGTITKTVRPGYTWSLPFASKVFNTSETPANISIIMREEQVVVNIFKE